MGCQIFLSMISSVSGFGKLPEAILYHRSPLYGDESCLIVRDGKCVTRHSLRAWYGVATISRLLKNIGLF